MESANHITGFIGTLFAKQLRMEG